MESSDKSAATSTETVLAAVCELHNARQRVTRYSVAELTKIPMVRVDDRLKVLVEREQIKRVLKGEYVPTKQFEPVRDMSRTILSDGRVKYEIGDDLLTLTPEEDRVLANLTAGAATLAAQIATGRAMAETAEAVVNRVDSMERLLTMHPTRDVMADILRSHLSIERQMKAMARNQRNPAPAEQGELPGMGGD